MSFAMPKKGDGRQRKKDDNKRPARGPKVVRGSDAKRTSSRGGKPRVREDSRIEKGSGRKRKTEHLPPRPPKKATLDERLAYYSKKYGEDFIVVTEPVDMKKTEGEKSFFMKILGKFKKEKEK